MYRFETYFWFIIHVYCYSQHFSCNHYYQSPFHLNVNTTHNDTIHTFKHRGSNPPTPIRLTLSRRSRLQALQARTRNNILKFDSLLHFDLIQNAWPRSHVWPCTQRRVTRMTPVVKCMRVLLKTLMTLNVLKVQFVNCRYSIRWRVQKWIGSSYVWYG